MISFRQSLAEAKQSQSQSQPETPTFRDSLAQAKAERDKAKGQTLAEAQGNRGEAKRQVIDDVLLSARLTVQDEMLEEIKAGSSIDDVTAKYKQLGRL